MSDELNEFEKDLLNDDEVVFADLAHKVNTTPKLEPLQWAVSAAAVVMLIATSAPDDDSVSADMRDVVGDLAAKMPPELMLAAAIHAASAGVIELPGIYGLDQ